MKKRLITTVILITTLLSYSQEKQPQEKTEKTENPEWTIQPKWIYYEKGQNFQFLKVATSKLESCEDGLKAYLGTYGNANYEKLISKTKEEQNKYFENAKKHYLGATILTTPNDTIGEYIKLNDIPDSDRFVFVASTLIEPRLYIVKSEKKEEENPFDSTKPRIYYREIEKIPYFYNVDGYYNAGKKTKALIQNLNTKKYYVVNQDALDFTFRNCEKLPYGTLAQIYKIIPKALTPKEQELVTRYKLLIKTAKVKTVTLGTIQRKYLTRGYFDESKVNAIDKKTYNKTLSELKVIAKQLSDIDSYEDKDDKAQDKLTMDEIATLSNVNDFNYKYYPIN
ncbi:hypothetical protein K5L04_09645 [Flavobacterium psychrophilum]|uniref:hypothetical protein n=1 Tax=Flavobacterium psychrophilum TaxID=96345 RepID=UPI001C8F8667|nr:hypothetical protein [Flavobacterium psychrophilum]QZK99957.1 hypothetical protein K5L04_09645 [Flavobacterium psychrophilum]